jgi:hypothetical protein
MTEGPGSAESLGPLIAASRTLTQQIVEEPDALAVYDFGMDLLQLGMRYGATTEEAISAIGIPLWLIWGSLTDAVDHPGADPDPTQAALTMRRAAREWLDVCADAEARRTYLERWQYDECGYARPADR